MGEQRQGRQEKFASFKKINPSGFWIETDLEKPLFSKVLYRGLVVNTD